MFIDIPKGAVAATLPLGPNPLPDYQYETVRHLVFGSLTGVRLTIQDLHSRRYAQTNDWSKPISTGRANEVMVIPTRRVRFG